MKQYAMPKQSSYATLFDVFAAREVAARVAQLNLPRRVVRPLDRYPGRRVAADLAAYDAAVDLAPTPEEEIPQDTLRTDAKPNHDADGEDEDDF